MSSSHRRKRQIEDALESATKKRTKQLECAICMDIFDDPISLSCGHTFCRTCLCDMREKKCPLCNKVGEYLCLFVCSKCVNMP